MNGRDEQERRIAEFVTGATLDGRLPKVASELDVPPDDIDLAIEAAKSRIAEKAEHERQYTTGLISERLEHLYVRAVSNDDPKLALEIIKEQQRHNRYRLTEAYSVADSEPPTEEEFPEISKRQRMAIPIIARAVNWSEAAKQVGVTRNTILDWRHNPKFVEALNQYTYRLAEDVHRVTRLKLIEGVHLGVETLMDVCCNSLNDSARVGAASHLTKPLLAPTARNGDGGTFGAFVSDPPSRDPRYCPHEPMDKQKEFLALGCKEALFGGAVGGGKSEAMLMAALQHVDQPGYSAIIFRRTYADLALPGALMDRAKEWLAGTDAKWNGNSFQWRFPSGAVLAFGYLQTPNDKYRYQSAEFQFIGFDEVTQFGEQEYKFMFSRLRKTTDMDVPLRIRCATNPIGAGMEWVRKRFVPPEYLEADPEERFSRNWETDGRVFVPARLADNVHLDAEQYTEQLMALDPETRSRLLDGNWEPAIGGRIRRTWFRHYTRSGDYLVCDNADVFDPRTAVTVAIVDPAGTAPDTAKSGHSWSVISIWKFLEDRLILWNVLRGRWETPELLEQIHNVSKGLAWIGIESEGLGKPIAAMAARRLNVKPLKTKGKDKLSRAVPYINLLEQGKVWFPERAEWLDDWESEHILWTGAKGEATDQIDTASYAAVAWLDHRMSYSTTSAPFSV